ncbi:Methyltransferase-like protein 13 [Madurella mycetomatis]|uniref:Methyltransferase-like protein 13 n=1 Tax=Madurella mycetomatis TaxID=100816 RepID=A0A175WAT8_9PEZI|nr:Methyltransferase-like protein 13 [Madurella mycetomatis]KXX82909.1 Methyltransferase-like protein 13 [Madurella mycetomatis]
MPIDFDKQSYWHERFTFEKSFEWLTPSTALMDLIIPYLHRLPNSSRILHLGSGTSDLHNHLRREGFPNVTNVDFEPIAIERGQQLERDFFGDVRMGYRVADATRLDTGEKYPLVIDKSTADAIACAGEDAVMSLCRSVYRCLDAGGIWISLSYSQSRFEDVQFLFEVEVIRKIPTPKAKPTDPDVYHYCYLLRPRQQPL